MIKDILLAKMFIAFPDQIIPKNVFVTLKRKYFLKLAEEVNWEYTNSSTRPTTFNIEVWGQQLPVQEMGVTGKSRINCRHTATVIKTVMELDAVLEQSLALK